MLDRNLVEIFIRPLEEGGIEYMVTGSIASIIYGEPRLTHDIDLVVDLREEAVNEFLARFPLSEFYCPPFESVLLEIRRESRAHFNLIHHRTGFKADCYPRGKDPLHDWGFKNKKTLPLTPILNISVAPMEYVILRKLEYFRETS